MIVEPPDPAEIRKAAAPIELFFDLVFVFAFIQLSHYFAAHLTWRGLAETLTMLLAVLMVWVSTSWSATVIRSERARPTLMLLTVMGLGLFMNAAIKDAFSGGGRAFALPLILIEVGRASWTLIFVPAPPYREHYWRTLIWIIGGVPLWVAGALAGSDWQLIWWALAATVQIIGIWTAHPVPGRRLHSEAMPFDAPHFLERCALFLLIALGETVISTGLALSETALDAQALLAGICALAGTTAMWAIIFGPSYDLSAAHLHETSNPVRVARSAVNAVILMVAGLILTATANQTMIAGAHGHAGLPPQFLLMTGPQLFVAGHLVYMTRLPGFRPFRHMWGIVALLVAGLMTLAFPPLGGLALIGAILAGLALIDRILGAGRAA